MALPPVLAGAVQLMAIVVGVPTPVTAVGTEGVDRAVTRNGADARDTSEAVPLPVGVTVKVYNVPLVRPLTVQCCGPAGGVVLLTTVQVRPSGELVTVYVEAMPSGVNETTTAPLADQATVGVASGDVPAVSAVDGPDTVDVVPLPEGVTVNVYDTPLVRPVTVQLCAPVGGVVVLMMKQLPPAGELVTVYRVAVPSATKLTLMAPVPALPVVGVAKELDATTAVEDAEIVEVEEPRFGTTVNVYDVPLVSPEIVQLCAPVGAVVVFETWQVPVGVP